MPIKVVVIVSGGNVQCCYATQAGVEIEVIDFDNIAEDGDAALAQAKRRATEIDQIMQHIY
jgi:hypothetical protein